MKNTLYLFFFILLGCSDNSLPRKHTQVNDNLQFTFEAHYMNKQHNSVSVKVQLQNLSQDTMYFHVSSCNSWIGESELKTDNMCGFLNAIQCFDTIPIMDQIAPNEIKKSTFAYALCDDSWMKVNQFRSICFGLRCYPIKKNAVTNENLDAYLKNRKSIRFDPATVEILE